MKLCRPWHRLLSGYGRVDRKRWYKVKLVETESDVKESKNNGFFFSCIHLIRMKFSKANGRENITSHLDRIENCETLFDFPKLAFSDLTTK